MPPPYQPKRRQQLYAYHDLFHYLTTTIASPRIPILARFIGSAMPSTVARHQHYRQSHTPYDDAAAECSIFSPIIHYFTSSPSGDDTYFIPILIKTPHWRKRGDTSSRPRCCIKARRLYMMPRPITEVSQHLLLTAADEHASAYSFLDTPCQPFNMYICWRRSRVILEA